jgi:hypothetical protein
VICGALVRLVMARLREAMHGKAKDEVFLGLGQSILGRCLSTAL